MVKYLIAPFIFIILSWFINLELFIDNKVILISYFVFLGLFFLAESQLINFPYWDIRNNERRLKIYDSLQKDLKVLSLQLSIIVICLCCSFCYPYSSILNFTVFCTTIVYSLDCLACIFFCSDLKRLTVKTRMDYEF